MRLDDVVTAALNVLACVVHVAAQDLPSSLCTGCRMRNGKGFNTDPNFCYNYIHCHFNQGGFGAAERRPCTPGQFWNQTVATCLPAYMVNCPNDQCRFGNIRGYAVAGNCRAYWKCRNQRTIGIDCCPSGYRWHNGFGCLTDATCVVQCPPKEKIDTNCYYERDTSNPRKYRYTRRTSLTLCCPRGLAFEASTCGCTKGIPIVNGDWCQPSVRIEFFKSVYDRSLDEISINNYQNKVSTRPDPSATDGWVGYFNTNGRLIMPRFANAPFGSEFKIFLRFKENQAIYNGTEILISNADCGKQPTFMLSINRLTKELVLMVKTSGITNTMKVSYIEKVWKDVVIMFESRVLFLSVDNRSNNKTILHQEQKSVSISGNVDVSACALNLGWGEFGVGFRGVIDAFRVYLCIS